LIWAFKKVGLQPYDFYGSLKCICLKYVGKHIGYNFNLYGVFFVDSFEKQELFTFFGNKECDTASL